MIEGCFSIINKAQQVVPFIFNHVQDLYWRARTRCDALLKYRKPGFSTLFAAEFLVACMVEENANAVMVAHREEDARILFDRVHDMRRRLQFQLPISRIAENHLHFTQTNSKFRVITAASRDAGRSRDITHLHLSERALYPDESFLAAVEEACVPGARRIVETTANGAGTPFEKFWIRTKRGDTAYKAHFFAWWQDPANELVVPEGSLGQLDEIENSLVEAYRLSSSKLAWRRSKMREMTNPDLFPQEFPANDQEAFLASGRMVFDWLALQRMSQLVSPPKWLGEVRLIADRVKFEPRKDGLLSVWSMPRESGRYILSADVAEGVQGGAYSVADVLDTQNWEQVAQWRGHVAPDRFADVLGDLGAWYNWATVCPEVNNHGLVVCLRLRDKGYPSLYVREDEKRKDSTEFGWMTTERTKTQCIDALAAGLRDFEIKINSRQTIDEMRSFVHFDNGKMGPQAGAFADCVMSLAIGVKLLGESKDRPQPARMRFREAMGLPKRIARQENGMSYGRRDI